MTRQRNIKVKPPRKPAKSKPAKARRKTVSIRRYAVFNAKDELVHVLDKNQGAYGLPGWCARPITITYRKARP